MLRDRTCSGRNRFNSTGRRGHGREVPESISSNQARMPPRTLLTDLNPFCFKNCTALSERTPTSHCR